MPLLEEEAPSDPFELFTRWFREAREAGAPQPEAMTLATSGEDGVSARMVLFKGLEDGAFVFYTNYDSRKGRDIGQDRRVALVFFWAPTRHQVRVYGTARKVSREASSGYFH
ncbi:MAG TPA: pyridoxamine 5'-phosphate oxidase family protein, partial [Candidatus Dormibacteraeota bacterium]|nr:pyridoxamine 5'-phosphate oxidase family protein [Candidatus Dormibacteraeota bacterium]